MSQAKILDILKECGGTASSSEIREIARDKFPDQTLYQHADMRLNSLKKRGLVNVNVQNSNNIWRLTEFGKMQRTEEFLLAESCDEEGMKRLEELDIEIVNIVSTANVGASIDLYLLSEKFDNFVFEPESDSQGNYYPAGYENILLRIPSTGRITIVGAKDPNDVRNCLEELCYRLNKFGIETSDGDTQIIVQNIVGVTNIGRELDLDSIAEDIESQYIDFNPANHPGIFFRPTQTGNASIYRSGKITFVGVKSYIQMASLYEELLYVLPFS